MRIITKTIDAKFVEAWGNVENPNLDCVNPHFKSKYASLKETQRVIREACKPLGLMYQQKLVECGDGQFRLYSYVKDADGGTVELSVFPVENVPNSQAFGSELTYKKRQQAQADWGIVGEEDDDGNAIAGSQQANTGKSTASRQNSRPQASHGQQRPKQGKWDKLNALKAEAMELGISEDGQKGAIANVLKGKSMRDATDAEIRACEEAIAGLVKDKRELTNEKEAGDDGQR